MLWLTGLPELTIDPLSQSAELTCSAMFTAIVSGVGKENFSYQWKHNGEDINGETKNKLTIDGVSKDHSGTYECVVMNEYGDSSTSTVSVLSEADTD